jgi:uncharacterized protein
METEMNVGIVARRSLLTLGVLAAMGGMAMAQTAAVPKIETTGIGTVFVVPDVATLRVGVQAAGEKAVDAFGSVSAPMNTLVEALKAAGVKAENIQTSSIQLMPQQADYSRSSGSPPEITGYIATVEVTILIEDVSKIGTTLDAALANGANVFQSVGYDLKDREPVLDQARQKAALEARRKAELYATALTVKIGALEKLTEMPDMGQPVLQDYRAKTASGAEVLNAMPGQIPVTATVGTIWTVAP